MNLLKKIKNTVLKRVFKNYTCCSLCETPFPMCSPIWITTYINRPQYGCGGHVVGYDSQVGHAYLCKECWDKLSIDERIELYSKEFTRQNNKEEFEKCRLNICRGIVTKSGESFTKYERLMKLRKIGL